MHGGFIVPYSPEYLRFRSNPAVLREVHETTGGEELDASAESIARIVFGEDRRQPKRSSKPVFDWFLIALACLIPLDVAMRRVQIDMYLIKSWLGLTGRAGVSGATMGALLKRKREVGSALDARREEARPMVSKSVAGKRDTPRRQAARRPVPGPPQTGKIDQERMSTTERLLAMKRKRRDEEDVFEED